MKVVCSYCARAMGEKEPLDNNEVSHGMCRDCLDHFKRQWEGLSLGEYLDSYDTPVAAVDADGRIIALNSKMTEIVGRVADEAVGRQPGDIIECQFARLPKGCGRTVHCKACAIRRALNCTIETGDSCINIPASVNQGSKRAELFVSTEARKEYVLLTVTSATDTNSNEAVNPPTF